MDYSRYSLCMLSRHLLSAVCMGLRTELKAPSALFHLLVDLISSDIPNLWRKITKNKHKV
jgi:hypothetical protein